MVIVASIIKRVDVADCRYCAECELVCPTGAIQCPFEIVIEESLEITIEE
jgi:ferredoxin